MFAHLFKAGASGSNNLFGKARQACIIAALNLSTSFAVAEISAIGLNSLDYKGVVL